MSITQVASQIIIIFLLMLLGALIRESGFLHSQSISDITNIALYFLSPMVIFKAFQQDFSLQKFQIFIKLVLAVFIGYLVTIIVAKIIFHKIKDENLKSILLYGSIYSNNGFMGVPLAQALFGSTGVFYSVASLIGFNVMSWTQGISMFKKSTHPLSHLEKLKKIILNPNILAILAGLIIFIFSIKLPAILSSFLNYGSQAFTPISMIVIGSNLVGLKLKDIKLTGSLTVALLLRNFIFPLVNLMILWVIGIHGIPMVTTVLLAACPVAGLVVLFTLQAKGNTKPAVILMSISTILSLITIPFIYFCTSWFK
ncbi:AEC family transporter [Lactobacillus sp. PSON]|uniref:AEC family transporter n=1 Tax=Lactobacillus sp. PSON TaxID=3455454 RepID=UPI004041622F